jgi:Mrp family chromosome partitioning ATPase
MSQTVDSNGRTRGYDSGPEHVEHLPERDIFVDPFADARQRPSGAAIDAFRTLALTVDRLLGDSHPMSVAVLSSHAGDGRSLTAELLARGLSEIRPPVRLLDADPFDPTANDAVLALDLVDDPGAGPLYAELTLGRELFANQRDFLNATRTLLHRAKVGGATVVIDLPACRSSSIAFAVAQMADAAIYVARAAGEISPAHAAIRAQLDLLGVHLLGVVFNEH